MNQSKLIFKNEQIKKKQYYHLLQMNSKTNK